MRHDDPQRYGCCGRRDGRQPPFPQRKNTFGLALRQGLRNRRKQCLATFAIRRVGFRRGERGGIEAAIHPGRYRFGVEMIVVDAHDTPSYLERSTSEFLRPPSPDGFRREALLSSWPRSSVPASSTTDETQSA